MKGPACATCSDTPAPHEHPKVPGKRFCRACLEHMNFAEDLAASQGENRIGDAGRRAATMAGRVVKGGR